MFTVKDIILPNNIYWGLCITADGATEERACTISPHVCSTGWFKHPATAGTHWVTEMRPHYLQLAKSLSLWIWWDALTCILVPYTAEAPHCLFCCLFYCSYIRSALLRPDIYSSYRVSVRAFTSALSSASFISLVVQNCTKKKGYKREFSVPTFDSGTKRTLCYYNC